VRRLGRLFLALALALTACGGSKDAAQAAQGRRIPGGARLDRDLDPIDVIPADLDLVVRVDLGRMRSALGPTAADDLSKRALQTCRSGRCKARPSRRSPRRSPARRWCGSRPAPPRSTRATG
jgi:hypothetical protein